MSANWLHTYQCSFCKTTAFSTIHARRCGVPIKCVLCLRIMAYQWSETIPEAEWQDRNRRPVEFRAAHAVAVIPPEQRTKRCGRRGCLVYKPKAELLNGRFCSEECGAADSLDVAASLERIEKLYQEHPWLRPKAKEIA